MLEETQWFINILFFRYLIEISTDPWASKLQVCSNAEFFTNVFDLKIYHFQINLKIDFQTSCKACKSWFTYLPPVTDINKMLSSKIIARYVFFISSQ